MSKIVFVFAFALTVALSTFAHSAEPRAAGQQVGASRNGPISKLIELERRKNEWLRQRFAR